MSFALATCGALFISVAQAYFGYQESNLELQFGAFLWLAAGGVLLRLTMMDVFDDNTRSLEGEA